MKNIYVGNIPFAATEDEIRALFEGHGAVSRVLGWPEWPFYLPGLASLLLWAAIAGLQLFEPDADG